MDDYTEQQRDLKKNDLFRLWNGNRLAFVSLEARPACDPPVLQVLVTNRKLGERVDWRASEAKWADQLNWIFPTVFEGGRSLAGDLLSKDEINTRVPRLAIEGAGVEAFHGRFHTDRNSSTIFDCQLSLFLAQLDGAATPFDQSTRLHGSHHHHQTRILAKRQLMTRRIKCFHAVYYGN